MKKLKIALTSFVLIALCCVFSNANAINTGDTINFQQTKPYIGAYLFNSGEYTGTCCQAGVNADDSGRATVTEVGHDQLLAKVAYYIESQGWLGSKKGTDVPGAPSGSEWKYSRLATTFIQRTNQGSAWAAAYLKEHKQPAVDFVEGKYADLLPDIQAISVPANFKVFKASPTNNKQDFVIWHLFNFSGSKTYASDTPNGKNGAPVISGNKIKYQIDYENASGNVVITDTLSKGLQYESSSLPLDSGYPKANSDGTTTLRWTTNDASKKLTYTAKIADDLCSLGINQVKNHASLVDGVGTHNLGELKNPVPSKCYANDTANGNNHSSVKVGDIIKYTVRYANTTSSSQVVKITDTLGKGLEFVENSPNYPIKSKTGSSRTSTKLEWERTLAAGASETLTYSAKVTSDAVYVVNNNANVKIGNNDVVTLTPLDNPTPKKEYGGTGLADNPGWNHHEVKTGQDIKYKVSLANVKNTEQTVVVTDVLSKGLTYNNDVTVTNGTITSQVDPKVNSDTKETTMVWTVTIPAKATAVLNYSAKVNDDAVNLVNNNATAAYSGDNTIKLNELYNPVPKKQYDVDTANGMNGKIVQKDDIITYNISYANPYSENATVNLRDTLSKGLTYEAGTAKVCDHNKENCKSLSEAGITEKVTVKNDGKTEILWTRTKMQSLGIETIVYDVKVTGETIRVENDFDIKTCKESESTEKTETITNCQEQINPKCAPLCDPATDKDCKAATDNECASTKQECTITGLMCSNPWMDIEELKNPVPVKEYDKETPAGYGETAVSKGDRIRYNIRYVNVAEEKVTATIKDTLSRGITYIKGTSKIGGVAIADPVMSKDGRTLTWTRELEKDQEESLTYEVKVTGETLIVNNKASMTYSNNPEFERFLNKLYNPVPQKTYAKNTKAGKNGSTVKKNDVITYSIKYSNVKKEKQTIIISDYLSKGLNYQKGTAKINGKVTEPDSISKDANGTMLIWMTELEAGGHAELVYGAKVTGEKMIVENNANIQYGHDPVIHLDELRNPLVSNQIVNVPDTGNKVAIAGIIAGIVLVSGGGYVLYRRYKRA